MEVEIHKRIEKMAKLYQLIKTVVIRKQVKSIENHILPRLNFWM